MDAEMLDNLGRLREWHRQRVRDARRSKPPGYERARLLLREFLTPAQRRELSRHGSFRAIGSGGTEFRIDELGGVSGAKECGCCVSDFCISTWVDMPGPDVALAVLLMVQLDEPGFHLVADSDERVWFGRGDWEHVD